jgi:hypothetical protein
VPECFSTGWFVYETKQELIPLEAGILPRKRRKCTLMDPSICSAISSRAVLEFSYEGLPRTAEPRCHGLNKAGKEVLRAYQVGGYSKSRRLPLWRLYDVSKMSGIRQTGKTFPGYRPGYKPNDKDIISIHCHI